MGPDARARLLGAGMTAVEKHDRESAWGGASIEQVRAAVRQALDSPSTEGEQRAFALGELTCVVGWEPTGRRGGGPCFHRVTFRLRRGDRQWEHASTLPDLSLLARTCEHHLLFFVREAGLASPASPRPPSAGRTASPLSAADRLRALLHQGSHQGS